MPWVQKTGNLNSYAVIHVRSIYVLCLLEMKAQYVTDLEAIRVYEICFKMFVLSEKKLWRLKLKTFQDWVLEAQLKIEFLTLNNGARNRLNKTLVTKTNLAAGLTFLIF